MCPLPPSPLGRQAGRVTNNSINQIQLRWEKDGEGCNGEEEAEEVEWMEQEGIGARKCRFADEAEIVDTFSSLSSPFLPPSSLPSAGRL